MNGDGRPLNCERTTVDKELYTSRHCVDGCFDRIERLVVWDGVKGPGERHDAELQQLKLRGSRISQTRHRKPTAIWPTTLSPILTVFDMILMEVVLRVIGGEGGLVDNSERDSFLYPPCWFSPSTPLSLSRFFSSLLVSPIGPWVIVTQLAAPQ